MNTAISAPLETQKIGHDADLAWVHTVIDDLHHRACALERLVDSSRLVPAEPASAAQRDGQPTVATLHVDAAVWFAALEVAMTPRPQYPDLDPKVAPPG